MPATYPRLSIQRTVNRWSKMLTAVEIKCSPPVFHSAISLELHTESVLTELIRF